MIEVELYKILLNIYTFLTWSKLSCLTFHARHNSTY